MKLWLHATQNKSTKMNVNVNDEVDPKVDAYIYSDGNNSNNQSLKKQPESESRRAPTQQDITPTSSSPSSQTASLSYTYNSKKPKWWKNLSGNATKAQKRAMKSILETHRLPTVPYGEYLNWNEIFHEPNEIWLEIGFGTGDNLLALAHRKQKESISLVGAEIHKAGIGSLCRRMQEGMNEKDGGYWSDYELFGGSVVGEEKEDKEEEVKEREKVPIHPYHNLRIYTGDGIKLLPYISSLSVAVVLITFPDPFPNAHHVQFRVIQIQTILEIHRILDESNGRFFLATDHEGFYEWSHSVMDMVNREKRLFTLVDPCPERMEWLPAVSKYEKKGLEEGRQTRLSCWAKLK